MDVDVTLPTVELLKDSTRFFPPFHRSGHHLHSHHRLAGPTVTVEIKPKAGYLSRAYLVEPPVHRVKHSVRWVVGRKGIDGWPRRWSHSPVDLSIHPPIATQFII